nr:MAG TPA: hypothetical protein [Bacteriophage sp.]
MARTHDREIYWSIIIFYKFHNLSIISVRCCVYSSRVVFVILH